MEGAISPEARHTYYGLLLDLHEFGLANSSNLSSTLALAIYEWLIHIKRRPAVKRELADFSAALAIDLINEVEKISTQWKRQRILVLNQALTWWCTTHNLVMRDVDA